MKTRHIPADRFRALMVLVLSASLMLPLLSACSHSSKPKAPDAPSGLLAAGADGKITLFWNASALASSYSVKRGPHGGPYVTIASASSTSYGNAGLVNGTTYFYVVSASNGAGESADSAEAAAAPASELPALGEYDAAKNHIGMNLWFLSDWDGSSAFADAMKHARPWQDGMWTRDAACDDLGWPLEDASTVIITGSPDVVNGSYSLVFTGQADVIIMWAGGSVTDKTYDEGTNTTRATVTYDLMQEGSVGLIFVNTRRTPDSELNSGFSGVHLYRPGYPSDGSVVFTAPFLTALSKVQTVRMMEANSTNMNLVQHWSQRQTPLGMTTAGPSYTGPGGFSSATSERGFALEHQIQLANALGRDCWINIPAAADDEYVRKTALALRFGTDGTEPYTSAQQNPVYPPLDPSLRVYVEYANEIWNSAPGFLSMNVVRDFVDTLPSGHPVNQPEESNFYYRVWRYPAWRMSVISDVFRAVYGDSSMMNRVRPLLMTQQGNGQATLSTALSWLDSYASSLESPRTVNSYLYGAGGSGYYDIETAEADRGNADLYFAEGNYPPAKNVTWMGIDSVWAGNYGLKRIAYEGGPSLDYYNEAQAAAINDDPRMQDMVEKSHDAWSGIGGDLLVYYCVTGPQSWEFTSDIRTADTPKFRALDALNARQRAAVTLGGALPGTVVARDAGDFMIRTGYGWNSTVGGEDCIAGNPAGTWIALPAHSASAFTGSITVRGAAGTSDAVLAVWINGVKKGEVTLAASETCAESTALSVGIPAGLVIIRIEPVSGDYALRSVTVN